MNRSVLVMVLTLALAIPTTAGWAIDPDGKWMTLH